MIKLSLSSTASLPQQKISTGYIDDSSFQPVKGLTTNALPLGANPVLITLTVPNTWNSEAGGGTWFAIKAQGKIIARGLYTCAVDGQRMPITLNTVYQANNSGENTNFQVFWCTNGKGTGFIEANSNANLTILYTNIPKA